MKRVPEGKKRLADLAPDTAKSLLERFNSDIDSLISSSPDKANSLEERRTQIEEILARLADDLPKEVWLNNLSPEKAPKALEAIFRMTWRFLVYDSVPIFLSCDNPVFYFPKIGIANSKSELSVPLSSNVALWATWRTDLRDDYHKTTLRVAKNLNRRTVYNATRFVFHAADEDWVSNLVQKKSHMLAYLD